MPYKYSLPTSVSFTGKGLLGYAFGPLNQDADVYYIEVEKGHDTFMVSKKVTRTYYVLAGIGYFTIDSQRYDVAPGLLVEVPPGVEFCYSGKMTLIAFARPRLFSGNDTHTKWNPDVVDPDVGSVIDRGTWAQRLLRGTVFGKSPLNLFLRLNERLWNHLLGSWTALRPVRSYGNFLHWLVRTRSLRGQAFCTLFLRNRAEIDLIRRLLDAKREGDILRVAVLGCSTGPQAYSVAWGIRSARPDLKLILHGVDISRQAVEVARCGVYSLTASELTGMNIAERMTAAETQELFDRDGDVISVKRWIKQDISWHVADAGAPDLVNVLGHQDIVVANNFLCHMGVPEAERCLRNIARLVTPHGYLFVSGVDLDVRTRIANELGWRPLQELLEEIHEGDPWLRGVWPFQYAGLEPLDKSREDWRIRYAAAFEVGPGTARGSAQHETTVRV